MSIVAVSPLLLQRYELKYLITVDEAEKIGRYIEGFCELDYYSQISPKNYYCINSLYFDSPTFGILKRKIAGIEPTYSLRVRSYGDDPKPPYYSEIKIKRNDFSNKLRAKLATEDWAHVLQSGEIPADLDETSKGYLTQFVSLLTLYNAEPKILCQYKRKAYLSQIDEYARVTFDRDLRYQHCNEWLIKPDETQMCHYDNEELYPHPDDCVVLELKAEKKIPVWMFDIIRRFELTRRGFSKYSSAISETMSPLDPPLDLCTKMYR